MNNAVSGKVGAIFISTVDASVLFTAEATTGDVTHKRYTIDNPLKKFFDEDKAFHVYVDSIEVTTGFTVEYAGGVVVFTSSQGASVITVTGYSFSVEQRGGFSNWKLEQTSTMKETSSFEDGGHKTWIPTVDEWTASANAYWYDGRYKDALGLKMVFVFYTDAIATFNRYEGFGFIDKNSINLSVEDVVHESLSIRGTKQIFNRLG